ncbi:MAG TPA: CheR family methyltransferase [Rhodopila sp.]
MTELAPFIPLLRQAIGLDAASIGETAIKRVVREQLARLRMQPAAYLEHVRGSAAALQELIEAVVVSETWFFRDQEAFTALGRLAQEQWAFQHFGRTTRLLSLPCSTGEEPYSMAMALLDAGFPPERFRIDAVDVSSRVVSLSERAVYGRNAFRGTELGFRDRYFSISPAGAELQETVRRQVRFQQGNLFTPDFLPGEGLYDAVFCRNLLIYFDRETQDRCVSILRRLMTADGVLFVAPSEASLLLAHDFVSERIPMAFAFRKGPAVATRHGPAVRRIPPVPPQRAVKPVRPKRSRSSAAPSPAPVASPAIDDVARLADQGRLVEAAAACEAIIRRNGSSARAFYLMGLIHDAGGNAAEAERQYRKALYLDQDHQEALIHLALLLERQGKRDAAYMLRDRARRGAGG